MRSKSRVSINSFSGGINETQDPKNIKEGEFQNLENVLIDETGLPVKSHGLTLWAEGTNSECDGLFVFRYKKDDQEETENNIKITMDRDKSIEPVFMEKEYLNEEVLKVINGKLYLGRGHNFDSEPIYEGFKPGNSVRFAEMYGMVFMCDGFGPMVKYNPTAEGDKVTTVNVKKPDSAPTVSSTGTNVGRDGKYSYVVTFVTETDESAPSPITDEIQVTDTDVLLENIPVSDNPSVIGRNIYRTTATGAIFLLAQIPDQDATIDNNTDTSYVDNLPDTSLGREVFWNNGKPMEGLQNIREYNNMLFAHGVDEVPHRLYFSIPGEPERWAPLDFIDFQEEFAQPITAMATEHDRLYVFKHQEIYAVVGSAREDIQKIQIVTNMGSESQDTVASLNGFISFYDGEGKIYSFNGQSNSIISDNVALSLSNVEKETPKLFYDNKGMLNFSFYNGTDYEILVYNTKYKAWTRLTNKNVKNVARRTKGSPLVTEYKRDTIYEYYGSFVEASDFIYEHRVEEEIFELKAEENHIVARFFEAQNTEEADRLSVNLTRDANVTEGTISASLFTADENSLLTEVREATNFVDIESISPDQTQWVTFVLNSSFSFDKGNRYAVVLEFFPEQEEEDVSVDIDDVESEEVIFAYWFRDTENEEGIALKNIATGDTKKYFRDDFEINWIGQNIYSIEVDELRPKNITYDGTDIYLFYDEIQTIFKFNRGMLDMEASIDKTGCDQIAVTYGYSGVDEFINQKVNELEEIDNKIKNSDNEEEIKPMVETYTTSFIHLDNTAWNLENRTPVTADLGAYPEFEAEPYINLFYHMDLLYAYTSSVYSEDNSELLPILIEANELDSLIKEWEPELTSYLELSIGSFNYIQFEKKLSSFATEFGDLDLGYNPQFWDPDEDGNLDEKVEMKLEWAKEKVKLINDMIDSLKTKANDMSQEGWIAPIRRQGIYFPEEIFFQSNYETGTERFFNLMSNIDGSVVLSGIHGKPKNTFRIGGETVKISRPCTLIDSDRHYKYYSSSRFWVLLDNCSHPELLEPKFEGNIGNFNTRNEGPSIIVVNKYNDEIIRIKQHTTRSTVIGPYSVVPDKGKLEGFHNIQKTLRPSGINSYFMREHDDYRDVIPQPLLYSHILDYIRDAENPGDIDNIMEEVVSYDTERFEFYNNLRGSNVNFRISPGGTGAGDAHYSMRSIEIVDSETLEYRGNKPALGLSFEPQGWRTRYSGHEATSQRYVNGLYYDYDGYLMYMWYDNDEGKIYSSQVFADIFNTELAAQLNYYPPEFEGQNITDINGEDFRIKDISHSGAYIYILGEDEITRKVPKAQYDTRLVGFDIERIDVSSIIMSMIGYMASTPGYLPHLAFHIGGPLAFAFLLAYNIYLSFVDPDLPEIEELYEPPPDDLFVLSEINGRQQRAHFLNFDSNMSIAGVDQHHRRFFVSDGLKKDIDLSIEGLQVIDYMATGETHTAMLNTSSGYLGVYETRSMNLVANTVLESPFPNGLDIGPDGYLWYIDSSERTIYKMNLLDLEIVNTYYCSIRHAKGLAVNGILNDNNEYEYEFFTTEQSPINPLSGNEFEYGYLSDYIQEKYCLFETPEVEDEKSGPFLCRLYELETPYFGTAEKENRENGLKAELGVLGYIDLGTQIYNINSEHIEDLSATEDTLYILDSSHVHKRKIHGNGQIKKVGRLVSVPYSHINTISANKPKLKGAVSYENKSSYIDYAKGLYDKKNVNTATNVNRFFRDYAYDNFISTERSATQEGLMTGDINSYKTDKEYGLSVVNNIDRSVISADVETIPVTGADDKKRITNFDRTSGILMTEGGPYESHTVRSFGSYWSNAFCENDYIYMSVSDRNGYVYFNSYDFSPEGFLALPEGVDDPSIHRVIGKAGSEIFMKVRGTEIFVVNVETEETRIIDLTEFDGGSQTSIRGAVVLPDKKILASAYPNLNAEGIETFSGIKGENYVVSNRAVGNDDIHEDNYLTEDEFGRIELNERIGLNDELESIEDATFSLYTKFRKNYYGRVYEAGRHSDGRLTIQRNESENDLILLNYRSGFYSSHTYFYIENMEQFINENEEELGYGYEEMQDIEILFTNTRFEEHKMNLFVNGIKIEPEEGYEDTAFHNILADKVTRPHTGTLSAIWGDIKTWDDIREFRLMPRRANTSNLLSAIDYTNFANHTLYLIGDEGIEKEIKTDLSTEKFIQKMTMDFENNIIYAKYGDRHVAILKYDGDRAKVISIVSHIYNMFTYLFYTGEKLLFFGEGGSAQTTIGSSIQTMNYTEDKTFSKNKNITRSGDNWIEKGKNETFLANSYDNKLYIHDNNSSFVKKEVDLEGYSQCLTTAGSVAEQGGQGTKKSDDVVGFK